MCAFGLWPSEASRWPSRSPPSQGVLGTLGGSSSRLRLSALIGLLMAFARPSGPPERVLGTLGALTVPPALDPHEPRGGIHALFGALSKVY